MCRDLVFRKLIIWQKQAKLEFVLKNSRQLCWVIYTRFYMGKGHFPLRGKTSTLLQWKNGAKISRKKISTKTNSKMMLRRSFFYDEESFESYHHNYIQTTIDSMLVVVQARNSLFLAVCAWSIYQCFFQCFFLTACFQRRAATAKALKQGSLLLDTKFEWWVFKRATFKEWAIQHWKLWKCSDTCHCGAG